MLDSIIFVRHGQTCFNRRGLTTGWQDPGLTSEGRQQALHAAQLAQGLEATDLVVSPLRRCRETAAPLTLLSLPSRLEPDFQERGWGSLEGCPRDWRKDPLRVASAGVEPPENFQARVKSGLARLTGRPLVVSHSGVFRALSAHLGVESRPPINNGGVLVFWREACGRWRIQNETH